MNILITGWKGFIGNAVIKILKKKGIQWTPFDDDVLEKSAFNKYKHCDTVLHLAGINRVTNSYDEQKKMIDVNYIGTLNAMHFAQKEKRHFFFTSSCCYGNPQIIPTPENCSIIYYNSYSFSKWQCEHALSFWNQNFGLEGIIFRIFNIYGPNQPRGFLISDIIEKIQTGSVELFNINSVRDYIYIEDVAQIITEALLTKLKGLRIVNVGTGIGNSVKDVVELIFEIIGKKLPVKNNDNKSFIKISIADNRYLRELFCVNKFIDLRTGITQVLKKQELEF